MARIVIPSARLTLRTLLPEDLTAFWELERNSEAKRYLGGPISRSIEKYQSFIANINPLALNTLAVIERDGNHFIGRCGLKPRPDPANEYPEWKLERDIEYVIHPNWTGKGFATEVVQTLIAFGFISMRLSTIRAFVHPDNHASVKVLVKCRFEFIGHQSGNPGAWDESVRVYALSASRFLEGQ